MVDAITPIISVTDISGAHAQSLADRSAYAGRVPYSHGSVRPGAPWLRHPQKPRCLYQSAVAGKPTPSSGDLGTIFESFEIRWPGWNGGDWPRARRAWYSSLVLTETRSAAHRCAKLLHNLQFTFDGGDCRHALARSGAIPSSAR